MDYNSELLSKLGQQVTIFLIHDLTQVEMFENMGGNIPGGNLVGIFQGGVRWAGIFRVGVFLIPCERCLVIKGNR